MRSSVRGIRAPNHFREVVVAVAVGIVISGCHKAAERIGLPGIGQIVAVDVARHGIGIHRIRTGKVFLQITEPVTIRIIVRAIN